MLQLRLMEKRRELVCRADVDALIDGIAGVTLTAMRGARRVAIWRPGAASSWSCSRCAPSSPTSASLADKHGEPPLSEQD